MTIFMLLILSCLFGLLSCSSTDDHDDHDHDSDAHYEWGGSFPTPNDNYFWIAQKVDGEYADPQMKIVVMATADDEEASLEAAAEEANHLLEEDCGLTANNGDTLTPSDSACYNLVFDDNLFTTTFKVDLSTTPAVAFFAEHYPLEFELDSHYFRDDIGGDVEPTHEIPEAEVYNAWGPAMGGAILTNMATFVGLLLCALPAMKYPTMLTEPTYLIFTNAFASGALLACAFYLILFESTHLIAAGYEEETDSIWRWATCIISGFLSVIVIDICATMLGNSNAVTASEASVNTSQPANVELQSVTTPANQPEAAASAPEQKVASEVDDPVKGKVTAVAVKVKSVTKSQPVSAEQETASRRLIAAILIGDFMHNFTDGIVLGAAFMNCGPTFGWALVGGTVAHELAQELADYMLLTSRAGLTVGKALLLNFLSGTSVILGAIIVLSSDVSNPSIGMILAFGGGVYIYNACVECVPPILNLKTAKEKLIALGLIMLGCIAIGLVLLGHEHCEVGGAHDH